MRINNEDLIVAFGSTSGTISLAASHNLPPTWLGHICNLSIQLVFTGTPAGTFKLQGSNDIRTTTDFLPTHYTDIAGSSSTVSAAGDIMWNYQNCGFDWIRVVWTASGVGTSPVLTSARIAIKGI